MVPAPGWLDELALRPGPPWRTMGIRTLDLAEWLVVDDRYHDELAHKTQLLAERRDEVFAARPAADDPSVEVLELVVDWLSRHHPGLGRTFDGKAHPLEAAGRLVQEDLCLLVAAGDTYLLEGASLCFPSHWRLHEKLGRSLAAVHAPVPHYAEELETKVDRFFQRLRSDRPVQRRNLSIHSHEDLFSPEPFESPASFETDARGIDHVWLRSERQTLVRLPHSGAVLFTIKTQQCPVTVLAERPEIARALAATLRAEGADLASRGDRVPFPPWLAAWLDDQR
jgi:hypothetical protein